MEYIILAILAAVFFLGTSRSIEVMAILKDVDKRRNFAIRVLGFFVVSAWLKILPALLLTIYMHEHQFIAPEIYDVDWGRATIVGIYITPLILLTTATFVFNPILAFANKTLPKLRSWSNLPAVLSVVLMMFSAIMFKEPELFLLVFVCSVVLSIYISITLHASIETQLKLHFLPLAAIVVVTMFIFSLSKGVESLVGQELRALSSGGGITTVIKTSGVRLEGSLLLTTREAAYLQLHPSKTGFRDVQCLLRVPIANSIVQANSNGISELGGATTIKNCSLEPSSTITPDLSSSPKTPKATGP